MSTPHDPQHDPQRDRENDPGSGQGQQGGQDQYGQSAPQYGQQPQYGQPYGGGSNRTNGLAIGSLVAGVLAILTSCVWGLGILVGIVAIVLAVAARRRVKAGTAGQGGVATAGLVTGIVGLLLGLVFVVLLAVGFSLFGDTVEACGDLPPEEQQACIEEQLGG